MTKENSDKLFDPIKWYILINIYLKNIFLE